MEKDEITQKEEMENLNSDEPKISPTMKIVGSSAHTKDEREKDDFYATDMEGFEDFLAQLDRDGVELPQMVWEPACGEGNLSEVLKARGFHVLSTDKVDRGYGGVYDFKDTNVRRWEGSIITNPPYHKDLDIEFVERSVQTVGRNRWVIMLFKAIWAHSFKRFELFQRIGRPTYIYAHSKRIKIHKNNEPSKGGNALDYCWFMWQKGNPEETKHRLIASRDWKNYQDYTNTPKLRGTK